MGVVYNQTHAQAALQSDEVFVDIAGLVSTEPELSSDPEDILADGVVYAVAWGVLTAESELTFIDDRGEVRSLLNGGTLSTSGIAPNTITRYEAPAVFLPPAIVFVEYAPNIDRVHSPGVAGIRTTLPNASAGPIMKAGGQESTSELTSTLKFAPTADGGSPMIIEYLSTEPVFTGGVIPTNLTAPA